MVGLLVELLISGLLLWLYNKSTLLVLGFQPTKWRCLDLVFGFVSSSIFCGIGFYVIAIISNTTLKFNPSFTYDTLLNSSYWMLKSVITEELLFRGALLYIAIKIIGIRNACILSSVAFGIYHWFSYGIWGDIIQMIYIFILTGIGGLLFAYAFAMTKSVYLPVGLHLGWNLVSVVIFSQGQLGDQLLTSSDGHPIGGLWSIIIFIYQITVLPLVTYLYLRKQKVLTIKQQSPATPV
jgi:uncharacterized protein